MRALTATWFLWLTAAWFLCASFHAGAIATADGGWLRAACWLLAGAPGCVGVYVAGAATGRAYLARDVVAAEQRAAGSGVARCVATWQRLRP